MRDFIFHNPVKIYFGKGQARHIAQEVERVEGAVLVVYGGGSIKRNGAYDDVMAALAGTGRKIIELPGVTPNPRLDKALEGVRLVKEPWRRPDSGRWRWLGNRLREIYFVGFRHR